MPSSMHPGGPPQLTVDQLRAAVLAGEVDTVIVAFTDMQGRLQGKRIHGQFFIDHVLENGTEGCNYLLAVDVDMNTVGGYAMSSWERGYGDMFFEMDLTTLRRTPGHPASVTIQSDLTWLDGSGEVVQSPRTILKHQVEVAEADGYVALAGTELEFILFEESYETAWDSRYHGLTGANRYNVDYSILGGSKVEPVLREIRNEMYAAGMNVESAKGECNFGQHEIGFLFDGVVRTCDNHSVYKTGAKEIAARHGQSLTFMAKFDQREGNSCHIHLSLRGTDGEVVFADDDRDGGRSELFDQFMAGLLATMRELTYFYAPNINSYKRFAAGSFAPTACAWGTDNRTCALRVVGHGPGMRVENRLPGGDVNPYLAVAAMMAGGLHGIREGLELPPVCEGNSCHIHLSLRGTDGEVVFADHDRDGGRSELFDQFMAGILATMRELTYFYAPNINSYKRFAAGSFAPTAVAWGTDNRTCSLRVVGHGPGLRVENRVPGGDVNPYLAVAAMLAGGLHGIREGLELPPVCEGNAYVGDYEHVPTTLAEARDLLAGSSIARKAFGDAVVDHYVNAADVELAAFNTAVTDWERVRGFERL